MDSSKYDVCFKSLRAYTLPDWALLGEVRSDRWHWVATKLDDLGWDPEGTREHGGEDGEEEERATDQEIS